MCHYYWCTRVQGSNPKPFEAHNKIVSKQNHTAQLLMCVTSFDDNYVKWCIDRKMNIYDDFYRKYCVVWVIILVYLIDTIYSFTFNLLWLIGACNVIPRDGLNWRYKWKQKPFVVQRPLFMEYRHNNQHYNTTTTISERKTPSIKCLPVMHFARNVAVRTATCGCASHFNLINNH